MQTFSALYVTTSFTTMFTSSFARTHPEQHSLFWYLFKIHINIILHLNPGLAIGVLFHVPPPKSVTITRYYTRVTSHLVLTHKKCLRYGLRKHVEDLDPSVFSCLWPGLE
jgi:hypothetical protein